MSLPTAYPLASAKPVSGVLPPAYGTSAYAEALPLAYGNTEVVLLNQFGKYEGITYTQSGNLTYFDSTGTLQTAATNTMVLDYDPSSLALRGYPFWEARTNSIRNNTMVGAAVGTPGTMPTNWTTFTALTGLTSSVVGTGTESGITYMDFRLSGTPSGAGTFRIFLESTTQVSASNGQSWAMTAYLKVAAGSISHAAPGIGYLEKNSVPSTIAMDKASSLAVTGAGLATQRFTLAGALTGGASIASVQPIIDIDLDGSAMDITLRIGLPALELGAFSTAVVKTTSASVTRAIPSGSFSTTGVWNNSSATCTVTFTVSTVVAGTRPIISFDDTTSNQQIQLYTSGTSLVLTVTNGGVSRNLTLGTIAANTQYKAAFRIQANNNAAIMTGGTIQTDTSGAAPVVTTGRLGLDLAGNAENGWIASALTYAAALPDASLAALV